MAVVAGWVVVGTAWSLPGVAVLSVGRFVVPAAVVRTVLLARKAPPGSSRLGVVTGLGLTPPHVAYLNREGPGNVCSAIAHGGHSCLQAWNPWPWAGRQPRICPHSRPGQSARSPGTAQGGISILHGFAPGGGGYDGSATHRDRTYRYHSMAHE